MKKILLCVSILFLVLSVGCKTDNKKNETAEELTIAEELSPGEIEFREQKKRLNYQIVENIKSETPVKAQIKVTAVFEDSIHSKGDLDFILLDIYIRSKSLDVFENHKKATVIVIYLFESIETAETNKEKWIAMLQKGPQDENPKFSYNESRLNALQDAGDNIKSRDEIAKERLEIYLSSKNISPCQLYEEFGSYEIDNIHKADAKYPDYGLKHGDYVSELNKESKDRILRKHSIDDSIYIKTVVYGTFYCK
jgi:hypothetical protein